MIDTHEEFAARVRTVIGMAMLALLAATVVALAADVLLIFFGGILLAILLRGVADQASAYFGLSTRLALAIVLLAFAIVVALAGWLLATSTTWTPRRPTTRSRTASCAACPASWCRTPTPRTR